MFQGKDLKCEDFRSIALFCLSLFQARGVSSAATDILSRGVRLYCSSIYSIEASFSTALTSRVSLVVLRRLIDDTSLIVCLFASLPLCLSASPPSGLSV